jgi:tRNA uridine 5-carboxymethylaminomethyl modification enzyme
MAGINAALAVQGGNPFLLDRSEAYIGVLIDDLVTRGTEEPYRMFTSRAEYRLILREDNADMRLSEKGRQLGLVTGEAYQRVQAKRTRIAQEVRRLYETMIYPREEVNQKMLPLGTSPLRNACSLGDLLKRPELTYQDIQLLDAAPSPVPDDIARQVEIQVKYQGYIDRQYQQVAQFKKLESIIMPPDLPYGEMKGLSREVREKLLRVRPHTFGQMSRISGITPAALSILMIYLKKAGAL